MNVLFFIFKMPIMIYLWFCNHLYIFVPEGILSAMISVLLRYHTVVRKFCLRASIPLKWSGVSLGSLHWLVSVHSPGPTIVCTTDFMIIGAFVCSVYFVCVLDLRTQRWSDSILQLGLSVHCDQGFSLMSRPEFDTWKHGLWWPLVTAALREAETDDPWSLQAGQPSLFGLWETCLKTKLNSTWGMTDKFIRGLHNLAHTRVC